MSLEIHHQRFPPIMMVTPACSRRARSFSGCSGESPRKQRQVSTGSERLQRNFWNSRGMQRKVFQSMSSTDGLVVVVNAHRLQFSGGGVYHRWQSQAPSEGSA